MHKEEGKQDSTHREKGSPRLPHERDESSSSQHQPTENASNGVIKQAYDDIVTGKKDTDLHGTPGLDSAGPHNK